MSAAPSRVPRWYVSVRSPYSWLALRDAEARESELLAYSEMRVFFEPAEDLAGDITERSAAFHYTPMSKTKHLYILRDIARLARQRGLTVTWPIDEHPAWEVSAVALARVLSQSQPEGKRLALALANARWLEGHDVHEESTVKHCLTELGLDGALAGLHRTPEGLEISRTLLTQMDRDGVFGVPYFLVGKEAFWGLERLAMAEEAYLDPASKPAASAPPMVLVEAAHPLDDQPGGCG